MNPITAFVRLVRANYLARTRPVAGGAFDAAFQLRDASFNGAANTNVNGSSVSLGRRGLPKGSQFVTIVDNPSSVGGTGTSLTLHLQLSLDNGTTFRTIATHEYGDPDGAFQGERATDIAQDFASAEYADANIDVRVQVVPIGTNTSNNTLADKIAAFITTGETTKFGRKRNAADALFV